MPYSRHHEGGILCSFSDGIWPEYPGIHREAITYYMKFKPLGKIRLSECRKGDHLRLPMHAILVHYPLCPFSFGCTAYVEYKSPLCADHIVAGFYITFFPSGLPVPERSSSLTLWATWVLPSMSREEEPFVLWLNDWLCWLTSEAAKISQKKKNHRKFLTQLLKLMCTRGITYWNRTWYIELCVGAHMQTCFPILQCHIYLNK